MLDLDDGLYWGIGDLLGALTAIVTFLGSWGYCMASYGYLFGFGLGWIPSLILASISGIAMRFLWGPLALLFAVLMVAAL